MRRYLVGVTESGSIAMALGDIAPEHQFERCLRTMQAAGRDVCWEISLDSPFEHQKIGKT